MDDNKLSHLDGQGRARMVDIGRKPTTERCARASARLCVSSELHSALKNNALEKGDAFSTARIAGIQAAKRTSDLIPLCHTLSLTYVSVDFLLTDDPPAVEITAEARTSHQTGVEMEALTAAAVAALTVYDMGKSIDKGIVVEHLRLEHKSGGRSGTWERA